MDADTLHLRLIAAAAAMAPALAMLAYFSLSGTWKHLRELIWIDFGLGFSVAIPIAGAAVLVTPLIGLTNDIRLHALSVAFLEAAIPEEVGRFLIVVFFVLRHEDLRRPIDAIVLTVMVALGFATIENLYYVFSSKSWGQTAMLRAITAVPMHATIGIVMGCFAARMLANRRPGWRLLAPMILLPVLLHGLYDYPVFAVQSLTIADDGPATARLVEFQVVFVAVIVATALSALLLLRDLARTGSATVRVPLRGPDE